MRKLWQDRLPLEITVLHESWRRKSVREQFFGTGKDWKALSQDPTFMKKLQELLDVHPEATKIADLSQKEFEDILESEELGALEDLKKAEIHEIKGYMPLYFWLIDSGTARARAIFAIPSFSEKAVEYGFSTTDQGLISAFEQMRDRYHKDFSGASALRTDPHPE